MKKRLQKVSTLTPPPLVTVEFLLKTNKIFVGFNYVMVFILTYCISVTQSGCCDLIGIFLPFYTCLSHKPKNDLISFSFSRKILKVLGRSIWLK